MSAITKLAAVLLSDGDVDLKRYAVSFTESKEVVDTVINELKEIEGINLIWKVDKHHNSYRARVYSKKLVEKLCKFTKTFRTRPHGTHPFCSDRDCISCTKREISYREIQLPEMSEHESIDFLKYYTTCDGGPQFRVRQRKHGSIQLDYAIKIGCCNPYLRTQIRVMFSKCGINAFERSDGLEIRDISSIAQFYRKIGFLETSKVRRGKLFRNCTKNNVVKLIILCGLFTARGHWITKNFRSIKNTKTFLKNLVSLIETGNDIKLISYVQEAAHVSLSPVDISRVS